MQDQGKRLLIASVLAIGVLVGWQALMGKKEEPKPKPAAGSAATEPMPSSPVGQSTQPTLPSMSEPAKPRGPEQTISLKFPAFTATFSSYGGVLSSWQLADKRYDRDPSKGELMPKLPDTGAFAVNFASSTFVLPTKAEWTGTKISDTQVSYSLSTAELEVTKTFTIDPAIYLVHVQVKVVSKSDKDAHQTLAITTYAFQDIPATKDTKRGVEPRVWRSATMRKGDLLETPVTDVVKAPRYESDVQWTGFEHPYLLVGVAPKVANGVAHKATFAEKPDGLMRTDIFYPEVSLRRGESLVRDAYAYIGPKHYSTLDRADSTAQANFHEVIDFGWFAFIGRPLLWLLHKFYSLFGNWGVAIMLLTVLVKSATLPFTTKSMRSMKAMAALAPQMKALQEKYKNDRQRQQIETMALYKQHKVNPLSGCLPIFLQMPIWLALYRMLSSAAEMYLQPFIPGWIDDLTAPDPFYVLPILLMVTMFLQARLTPANPDPSQRFQQRFLQYGMPLMFGVMGFFFASGLTLYIFTNTCLSALHSIYMNKFDKKSLAMAEQIKQAAAAADAKKVAADVKNAKNANPVETKSDDDDDEDGESAPEAAKPRQNNIQRQKRKKGRRR